MFFLTVLCLTCAHFHVSELPARILFIDAENKSGKEESIEDKVIRYFKFPEDVTYKCSECGVDRECVKWHSYLSYPKVLVVNIKRHMFDYNFF